MISTTPIQEICPTTAQEWLAKGAVLVDVREPNEVAAQAYQVTAIIHIPLSEFETRFLELPTDQPLVMACRSGARSLRAANFLRNNGFSQLANLQGGIMQWTEKGFPTQGATGTDCCSQPGCC